MASKVQSLDQELLKALGSKENQWGLKFEAVEMRMYHLT
jgi:hypothetical protein